MSFAFLSYTLLPTRANHDSPPLPLCPSHRHRTLTRPAVIQTSPSPSPVFRAIEVRAQSSTSLTYSVGRSSKPQFLDALKDAIVKASRSLALQKRVATLTIIFLKSNSESTPSNDLSRVIPVAKKTLAVHSVLARSTVFFGCTTAEHPGTDSPSAIVTLVYFPEKTYLRPFYVDPGAFDLDWTQQQWYNIIERSPVQSPQQTIMLLCHPDFEATADVLSSLDFAFPGVRKLGATAGHTNALDQVYLFNSDGSLTNGAIGLAMSSPHVQVDVTVAQGARGVGPVLEVVEVKNGNELTKVKEVGTATEAEGPPMTLLDMWAGTDAITQEDRAYAREYLLMGIEVPKVVDLAVSSVSSAKGRETGKSVDAEDERRKPVEMVIRKVVGFDDDARSLAVQGGDVRLGSRVQFQIRDERAAEAELDTLFNRLILEGSSKAMDGMSLMGALLIVDSERGGNLYGDVAADMDRRMYEERFPVPLAMLTSEQQIGPLPSGGLLGTAGNCFLLSASALYVSLYGRTSDGNEEL